MPVKVKLSHLVENLDFQSDEFRMSLNHSTGQVVTVSSEELGMAEDGEIEVGMDEADPGEKLKEAIHEEELVKPGRYRHFKGGEYEVIAVAKHSETEEEYVVYRALYGEGAFWIRPKKMFAEKLVMDGKIISRFEYLGDFKKGE